MENPVVRKLKNGFVICLVPYKGAKSVTLHLRGRAGSNYENTGEVGAAHIAEHLSVENSLKDAVVKAGGQLVGITSRDEVLYMVKVRKGDFKKALSYVSHVFSDIDFSCEDFEVQKKVAVHEIRRSLNVPEKLISRISYKNLYPDNRISKLNTGGEEDLSNLSLESVINFKKRTYTTDSFCLTVCGDVVSKKTMRLCEGFFTDIKKESKNFKVNLIEKAGLSVLNLKSTFFTQSHLKVDYYDTGNGREDKVYSLVCAKVLDNYLKNELKRKRGIAYQTAVSSFKSINYGILSTYVATGLKTFIEAATVLALFKSNTHDIFNENSLRLAKNQLLADLDFAFDKQSSRADFYSQQIIDRKYGHTFSKEAALIRQVNLKKSAQHALQIFSQCPKITILSEKSVESLTRKIFLKSS